MDNEQLQVKVEVKNHDDAAATGTSPTDLCARIAALIQAELAESLAGLDLEPMIHAEIDKAMTKIEQKIARARERAQRAQEKARRAKEKAQKAREKARYAAERAARRMEHRRHVKTQAGQEEADAQPQPPVSDQEQLAILKMLQEGKITTDQADILLKALSGQD